MKKLQVEGWKVEKLSDVCENLDSQRIPVTQRDRKSGDYPYYGASGIVDYVDKYIFDGDFLLVSEDGANLLARTYPIAFSISGKTWVNNHAHVLRFASLITQRFVEYYLNSISLEKYVNGMAQPKLNQAMLNSIPIPIPPLPEQQRIVSLLDETFAGLAQVHANAERNLVNAREVFESVLESIDAEKQPLGNLVNITTGKLNANAAVEDGQYPFFTCAREVYSIDKYAFDCEAILLAGNNASGDFNVKHYKGKFNAYQRTYVITVNAENKIDYRWMYFQLLRSLQELKSKSVGANTKFLKLGMIQEMQIPLPPLEEQRAIVKRLDALAAETSRLEAVYQSKLEAVEELKKSILNEQLAIDNS